MKKLIEGIFGFFVLMMILVAIAGYNPFELIKDSIMEAEREIAEEEGRVLVSPGQKTSGSDLKDEDEQIKKKMAELAIYLDGFVEEHPDPTVLSDQEVISYSEKLIEFVNYMEYMGEEVKGEDLGDWNLYVLSRFNEINQ